ncbi:hypothetical protein BYT27DRAFT_7222716 [Phlegmacium glaucopus]|nr:hypothetical protein BYT27DRAFT_7222716 [Phlegmacium glaucopus]
MLEFALSYHTALENVTSDHEMKLRQFKLSEEDWGIAAHLRDALKMFKDATLFFSCGTPNLAMVIPAMDHNNQHLTTSATDGNYLIALKAALAISRETLDQYYDKTDHSEVYWITMVLHPRHKLKYFAKAGWNEDFTLPHTF